MKLRNSNCTLEQTTSLRKSSATDFSKYFFLNAAHSQSRYLFYIVDTLQLSVMRLTTR